MGTGRIPGQQLLLFHSSLTCIYFPAVLTFMKYSGSLHRVGSLEFLPILGILVFGEIAKLSYTLSKSKQIVIGRMDNRTSARLQKYLLKFFKESVKFVVFGILLFISYYIAIVLFGAPLLRHNVETGMLALTLVILTYVPACLHLGLDTVLATSPTARSPNSGLLHEAVYLNIRAALLGAWLGAVPIPLDWDRPWQVWPITCVLGALVGYLLGNFFTLVRMLLIRRCFKEALT